MGRHDSRFTMGALGTTWTLVVVALWSCADAPPPSSPDGDGDAGAGDEFAFGFCGDGVRDIDEDCDDGNNFDGDGCSSRCTVDSGCGDGRVDRNEACDDGNHFSGDGCSSLCQLEIGVEICGNGVVDRGELCDGADLDGLSCLTQGFSGGILMCTAGCALDTSGCVSGEGCGNGKVEDGEQCDGSNLEHTTCKDLGFAGGTLGCTGSCQFDHTFCTPESGVCGDGHIDPGETCDGGDLAGATCESLGFTGGTLTCRVDCNGYKRDGCTTASRCGNGAVDAGELCDGEALNGNTCEGLGFGGGTLLCSEECKLDTAGCESESGTCGNGRIDTDEVCDGASLAGETCESQGLPGGTLACNPDCGKFDTRGCSEDTAGEGWTCDPSYYNGDDGCDCGCGLLDPDCANRTAASCDYCGVPGSCNVGPCPGTINPSDNATCDASGGVCGDGEIGAGEACDGSNLGGATCDSLGLGSGDLACAVNCLTHETSGCAGVEVPPEWSCDPTYYGTADGCDCGCGARDPDCTNALVGSCLYCDNLGSCNDADCPGAIDPANNANCVEGPVCGNGEIDAGEVCDGENLDEQTCTSRELGEGTLACSADCLTFDTSGCAGSGAPDDWTCNPTWYDADDGCDCECGVYDPDCDDPDTPVFRCAGGETCDLDGHCTGGEAACNDGSLDDGEVCDGENLDGMSCTDLDFDGGDLACAADCLSFDTSGCTTSVIPPGWTCSEDYYDAGDGCDCECGAVDPDCDDPEAEIFNCLEGQVCDAEGHCDGVPTAWTCDIEYYNALDGCDCDCGAYDPDCDDPEAEIFNCPEGQVCDPTGTCVDG